MSDRPDPAPPETPAERADRAETRRRWVTLAEAVAVAGVLIAGATLYLNWSERRDEAAGKQAEQVAADSAAARLNLRAAIADGSVVTLSDPDHDLLDTRIDFPAALGLSSRTPVTARIERDWFAPALLAATDGGSDEREGRLPVLASLSYRVGDATRSASAIVEITWATDGRLLAGRSLRITGARIRQLGGDQKVVDALWTRELRTQR